MILMTADGDMATFVKYFGFFIHGASALKAFIALTSKEYRASADECAEGEGSTSLGSLLPPGKGGGALTDEIFEETMDEDGRL
jgi:hypothetical protein